MKTWNDRIKPQREITEKQISVSGIEVKVLVIITFDDNTSCACSFVPHCSLKAYSTHSQTNLDDNHPCGCLTIHNTTQKHTLLRADDEMGENVL